MKRSDQTIQTIPAPADNSSKTILIADDSEAHRSLLSSMLTSDRFELVLKQDGLEVLEYLKSNTPDMMILDIRMPHLDGLSVTERVRWVPRLQHVPVLIITAHDDQATAQSIEWVKAKAVLYKSELTKTRLLSVVSGLLADAPDA